MTPADYEAQILASPLFSLPRDSDAWHAEAHRMVDRLYRYLLCLSPGKYADMNLEIVETANACIRSYTPEKGNFLHYFNKAIKNSQQSAMGSRQLAEHQSGMHVSAQVRKLVQHYTALAGQLERLGVTEPENVLEVFITQEDLSPERAEEIAKLANLHRTASTRPSDDGQEQSLLEALPDGSPTPEQTLLTLEEAAEAPREFLDRLDRCFASRQARQQPLLARILTARLLPLTVEQPELLPLLTSCRFWVPELYARFTADGTIPNQKEIGQQFHRSEGSISRTVSAFTEEFRRFP